MDNDHRQDFVYQPRTAKRQDNSGGVFVWIALFVLGLMALDHAAYAALISIRDALPFVG
jgi:hypothetical protein